MARPDVKRNGAEMTRAPRKSTFARTESRPVVPALKRSLAIIRMLNRAPALSVGVTEVANALALPKSVCFNILRALQEEAWVSYDAERRKYVLSPVALTDLSGLLASSNQASAVHEELVRLSLQIRVPCVLSRIEPDGSFVAIDKAGAMRGSW